MFKKRKNLIISVLTLLMILVSGFTITYAYWASTINVTQAPDKTDTIRVGEGQTVETTVLVNGGTDNTLLLVPVGREVADVSVSSITYTFNVVWAGDSTNSATGAKGYLSASADLSGADETELALFTVSEYATTTVTYGDTTEVSITVTFTDQPANKAQYDLIKNAILTLTVTFNVNPNA